MQNVRVNFRIIVEPKLTISILQYSIESIIYKCQGKVFFVDWNLRVVDALKYICFVF